MTNNFVEITRSLRLYVPQLPITLAEQMIRDRYRKILSRRNWSALRVEAEFQLREQKTAGTVSFTRGTLAIEGLGTSFDSDDIGRQIKIGASSPIYTIIDAGIGQVLAVDRPIGVTSSADAQYQIFDGYVTPPPDFMQFMVVTDPQMGWRLRHWVTNKELSIMDPQRTFFGQPYCLADRIYGQGTTPSYECWPYSAGERTIYYIYIKRGDDLIQDTDVPIWPIRSDAIVSGALADVARWPGTADRPNPYFTRPEYWKSYEAEYEDKIIDLERQDEDVYMTHLDVTPYLNLPLAPFTSTNWLYSHAV